MRTIGRLISGVDSLATALCGLMVLALVLHVTLEVVMRYVFNAPLQGTILFVSLYYMTAIAFLPLGAVEERDGHVVVEVLTNLLPKGLVSVCFGIGLVLSAVVAAGLAGRTWEEAIAQYNTGAFVMEADLSVSTWQTYFFLPVGFALMCVVCIWKFLCLVTGRKTGLILAAYDPGAPILKEE